MSDYHELLDLSNWRYDDLIFVHSRLSETLYLRLITQKYVGTLPPQFDNFNAGQEKAIEVRESRSRNDLGKLPNY